MEELRNLTGLSSNGGKLAGQRERVSLAKASPVGAGPIQRDAENQPDTTEGVLLLQRCYPKQGGRGTPLPLSTHLLSSFNQCLPLANLLGS